MQGGRPGRRTAPTSRWCCPAERGRLRLRQGCYVGQEVINRIDVKGLINKRLTGLEVEGMDLPPQGAEVLLGEQVVGLVTSATSAGGRVRALGVLRKTAWTPGTVAAARR